MTRPAWLTAMGLAVAVAGIAGLVLSWATGAASGPAPARAPMAEQRILTPRLTGDGSTAADAIPVQLIIPAIGVRTRLIQLGLTGTGSLQVPDSTDVAGWFDDGPAPGQPGPAIIAGHIDSEQGPAVFFNLSQLRPADRIYVRQSDGTVGVFTVTDVREYLKSAFPTAAVYGPAPGAQLRLITCGGTFDFQRRSYLSNVVVYASSPAGMVGALMPLGSNGWRNESLGVDTPFGEILPLQRRANSTLGPAVRPRPL